MEEAPHVMPAAHGGHARPEAASGSAGSSHQPALHPRWRQRLCACIVAHGTAHYERFMSRRKGELFGDLAGNVLEIGPGTGANLPYLPRSIRYIAAEPNPYMHPRLQHAAREHGIDMQLCPVGIEGIDLPDASIDAAICTLVLCSVEDPGAVLADVLRILRPGGRFIFVEHVAAPPGTWLRAAQRAVGPLWRVLGDGCQPDRETWRELEGAGFASLRYERFRAPVPLVSPHIAGTGTRGTDGGFA
jgi:SAM-dependent methyltransferase